VLYFKELSLNFAASEEANCNLVGCIDHTLSQTNDLCFVITEPRVRFRISLCYIRDGRNDTSVGLFSESLRFSPPRLHSPIAVQSSVTAR
jgi:hypothetical protein